MLRDELLCYGLNWYVRAELVCCAPNWYFREELVCYGMNCYVMGWTGMPAPAACSLHPERRIAPFGMFPNFQPCYCNLPRQRAISCHQLSLCRRKMKVIRQKMNEPYRQTRYAIERRKKHTACFRTRHHFGKNKKLGLLTPLVHLEWRFSQPFSIVCFFLHSVSHYPFVHSFPSFLILFLCVAFLLSSVCT